MFSLFCFFLFDGGWRTPGNWKEKWMNHKVPHFLLFFIFLFSASLFKRKTNDIVVVHRWHTFMIDYKMHLDNTIILHHPCRCRNNKEIIIKCILWYIFGHKCKINNLRQKNTSILARNIFNSLFMSNDNWSYSFIHVGKWKYDYGVVEVVV